METSIDLYSEEYVNNYADGEDLEQEIENRESEGENEQQESKDDEEKTKVKPKRVVKNPRPKLDLELLKGRRGLLCLEGYFKNKKIRGRGYEEQDLRYIMKTYEYWCHRLFPKFSFDDCISKLEKLGTKKNVQVYLKRIRTDLVFDEEQSVQSDDEGEPLTEAMVPQFDNVLPQNNTETLSGLTEEQMERIRINKEKANRLRLERMCNQNAAAVVSSDPETLMGTGCIESGSLDVIDHRSNSSSQDEVL